MSKQIEINQFELNILLDDEEKQDFEYLLNKGVYCNTCNEICKKGVDINNIFLNKHNDIKIQGTCKVCKGKVVRIMEFGEDEAFYKRVEDFKKSKMKKKGW